MEKNLAGEQQEAGSLAYLNRREVKKEAAPLYTTLSQPSRGPRLGLVDRAAGGASGLFLAVEPLSPAPPSYREGRDGKAAALALPGSGFCRVGRRGWTGLEPPVGLFYTRGSRMVCAV